MSLNFDKQFLDSFKMINTTIDHFINEFNNGKSTYDYAVCKCKYNMRYITPKDLSEFVSLIMKSFEKGLFKSDTSYSELQLFTANMCKRFIEKNNGVPIDTGMFEGSNKDISLGNITPHDLFAIVDNEAVETCVYSASDMKLRKELANKDIKVFKDMHLLATMNNLVNKLPGILESEGKDLVKNGHSADTNVAMTVNSCDSIEIVIINIIEEFILLMMGINLSTLKNISDYISPISIYTGDKESNVTTWFSDMKTAIPRARYNLPFDINIRNMVLSDISVGMVDTKNALDFIVLGEKSPIHCILADYVEDINPNDHDYNDRLLSRLFPDLYKLAPVKVFDTSNNPDEGERIFKSLSEADQGWLNTIVLGNNYMDSCYRKDLCGNAKLNPVQTSLDTLYKMFGEFDLKTDKEICNNIMNVYSLMISIIDRASAHEGSFETSTIKDILGLLGEIITRDIVKILHNNTRTFDYSDDMVDGGSNALATYVESFVMEELTNVISGNPQVNGNPQTSQTQQGGQTQTTQQTPQAKVSLTDTNQQDKSKQPSVTMKDKDGKEIKMGMNLLQRFITWIVQTLSKYFTKFNENHKMELKYINDNKQLNDTISNSLGKSFRPNVNNFPNFNIPGGELSKMNTKAVVDKWLNSQEQLDPNKVKAELYPGGTDIGTKIVAMKEPGAQAGALTNYILYGNIVAPQPYTGPLDKGKWDELVGDLTGSFKLIETINAKMGSDLSAACESLKLAMSDANSEDAAKKAKSERANQLFSIVQGVSESYQTACLNSLSSQFYGKSYKLYRDIVAAYNQQNRSSGVVQQQTTTATPQQQPQQPQQPQQQQTQQTQQPSNPQ